MKKLLALILVISMVLSSAIFLASCETEGGKTEKPTEKPTEAPTSAPTAEPTVAPTTAPTAEPTTAPTAEPTEEPTAAPTAEPTEEPTAAPTAEPTEEPTTAPTVKPTEEPTLAPTEESTKAPTEEPTAAPTAEPTEEPTTAPTVEPTEEPTTAPTAEPTEEPTLAPTEEPTKAPTEEPTSAPTEEPVVKPTEEPTVEPTEEPTAEPTEKPTEEPTEAPNPRCPDGTCEYKTVKGVPTCKICGNPAECLGVHGYAANVEGHWKPECEYCGKAAGNPQNHEYEERVEDEGDLLLYSSKCPICLFVACEQEVPYHINAFYSAGEFTKLEFTATGFTQNFGFEAGIGYGEIGKSEGSGSFTLTVEKDAEPNAPTGKFLVMKVRLPKSQSSFNISVRSTSAVSSYSHVFNGLASGWVTVIIDLSKAVKSTEKVNAETEETYYEYEGYSPDAAGDYYITDFTITGRVSQGESFDIAYALFCDKIEDAENFVLEQGGVTTVYRYLENLSKPETEKNVCVDENGNPLHQFIINDDGTHTLSAPCYLCGLKAVQNEPHSYTQVELENGDYAYACSVCGHSRFGVGVNINRYYNASAIDSGATNYFRNTKNGVLIDEKGGFEYASFSGQGNTAQIIFPRNTADSSATEKAAYFSVGTAKYFVMRMKTNNCAMNFTFTFATQDAELIEGKHNGVVKGMFPRTTTFNVPIALGGDDTWTTYVMDLTALAPNSWVADEDGNHTVYTMYCNIGGTNYTPNVNINFEYMAFVDDWNEVKAIVSDSTVINVAPGGVGNFVNTADKSCVGEHAGEVTKTETGYTVKCATCGFLIKEISVPEDINYYSDLGTMNKYQIGGLTKYLYDEEADVLYNRYEGAAGSHINLTGGAGAGTWTADKYTTGEYLVIKYRMQSTGLSLNIATKDFGKDPGYNDATRPYYTRIGERKCPTGLSYWSVALIKIPDVIGENAVRYTKGEELEIGIMISTSSSPYIFDIAYVAIVDSPEEAELLLEEGEVLEDLGDSWDGTITEVMPEAPESDEPEEGKEYAVTEFGPDQLVTPPEKPTGTFDITRMTEDGVSFVRINHMTVNKDGWAAINYLNGSNTAKGRYFAMKFRVGANGLDQTYLKIYTGTSATLMNEGQGVAFKLVEGGEWCVVVVDLLNCIGDKGSHMIKGPDGSYTLRYFGIRPFSNNQKGAVDTEAYMDIAYIKFFEHKSQIKDVVDTETYEWSIDRSTSTTLRTEDNSCVVCSVSESVDGSVYSYVCTSCGKVHKTVAVPESVTRYYSANDIATTGKVYYTTTGGTSAFAVEDGIMYTESKSMLQIIWQRNIADMDGKNSSSAAHQFTESVGNAKYLVVKARTSGEKGYLWMALSTDVYNAPLKVATENMAGYYKGHTSERDEWVNEETGDTVKGVLAGGEYRSATGYKGVYVIPTGKGNGEWQTYVVDIAALYGDAYAKKDGSDEYIIDTFFMNFGGDVDVSYIAFVEGDMSDVAELVDEAQVAQITTVEGSFTMVDLPTKAPENDEE